MKTTSNTQTQTYEHYERVREGVRELYSGSGSVPYTSPE